MGELADKLGGKIAGELIRADDWNALIDGVELMESKLEARVDALEGKVDAELDGLKARTGVLETDVAGLETDVAAIRQRMRQVTLRTTRNRYAIGEIAELTAQVTDYDGAPLDLSNAATRPWIDFVSAWGHLKPAQGFTSLGGADDRTISVQVNAEGVARVCLRADHAEGFADETEDEVAASLTTVLAANQLSIAATILQAATPLEANEFGAFRALSLEYDRTDAPSVRNYVDAYYIQRPIQITGGITGVFRHRWRDYRATVIAFAKGDSDSTTPDPNLGSCSLQVTFRDWISPWYTVDYLPQIPNLVGLYKDQLTPVFDDDIVASNGRFKDKVSEIVEGKGILGKLRDYQALEQATGGIQIDPAPSYLAGYSEHAQEAFALQFIMESSQVTSGGGGKPGVAFEAFANSGTRGEDQAKKAAKQVKEEVGQDLAASKESVLEGVREEQQKFNDELLKDDGVLLGLQKELSEVSGRVNGFDKALGQKADVQLIEGLLPGS